MQKAVSYTTPVIIDTKGRNYIRMVGYTLGFRMSLTYKKYPR